MTLYANIQFLLAIFVVSNFSLGQDDYSLLHVERKIDATRFDCSSSIGAIGSSRAELTNLSEAAKETNSAAPQPNRDDRLNYALSVTQNVNRSEPAHPAVIAFRQEANRFRN